MKTLKISSRVHKELKIFAVQHDENMAEFAEFAIVAELTNRKHKFSHPHDKQKSKPSNKK